MPLGVPTVTVNPQQMGLFQRIFFVFISIGRTCIRSGQYLRNPTRSSTQIMRKRKSLLPARPSLFCEHLIHAPWRRMIFPYFECGESENARQQFCSWRALFSPRVYLPFVYESRGVSPAWLLCARLLTVCPKRSNQMKLGRAAQDFA